MTSTSFVMPTEQELLPYVLESMTEAVVLLDENLNIQLINESARQMLDGMAKSDMPIGMYFYEYVGVSTDSEAYSGQMMKNVIEHSVSRRGVLYRLPCGKHISFNVVPLKSDGGSKGVLLTAEDVSTLVETENELDLAFSLTLPNSKVEYKMKATPEYTDEYDSASGMITITGVIQDGLYRHVVNSLKILASMKAQGVTNVIGIDKDLMVRAIIYHDLGKAQPELKVGDTVDPKQVFEVGRLHAVRGAEIAKHYYDQPEDVVEIIRYHHHRETDLPDTFPWRLLPMLRLFQLIDGLSAAVTRGGVDVTFSVNDCVIRYTEVNRRPQYSGTWQLNLYTGEQRRVTIEAK